MKQRHVLVLLAGMLALQGCAISSGVAPFGPVDLNEDLSPSTLARYRGEVEDARRAGQGGHLLSLEGTNWWPLGLLAYWTQGKAQAMVWPDGNALYMVSESRGYGPLSVFYVSGANALYDAEGRRLSTTGVRSILWGHLAMLHSMQERLEGGGWHEHNMSGFLHHLINVETQHGRSSVSLFSEPNPVAFGG